MRPLCQKLQRQGFNGDGRTTVRPYKSLLVKCHIFPTAELKSSSAIFWFRTIWLRSKRLPFGEVWIGNDLEMSGVL